MIPTCSDKVNLRALVSKQWLPSPVCDGVLVVCVGGFVTELNLANRNLTGPLPLEFFQFSHLRALVLSNNNITGVVPLEIGKASNLLKLRLDSNKFVGTLPAVVGQQLTKLKELSVTNNFFTGTVPMSFDFLVNLTAVSFMGTRNDGNDLCFNDIANVGKYLAAVSLTNTVPGMNFI